VIGDDARLFMRGGCGLLLERRVDEGKNLLMLTFVCKR
jgi:hypothetical protein